MRNTNNILKKYSSGQVILFKDYSGKMHHSTNLDLETLLDISHSSSLSA